MTLHSLQISTNHGLRGTALPPPRPRPLAACWNYLSLLFLPWEGMER